MYPYNFKRGQSVQTDMDGVSCDRWFGAVFQVKAADAVALSNAGILAATALTAEAQVITEGITNPVVARGVLVKGNASGMTGDVVVDGTRAGKAVLETIALNGATAVQGSKAFDTITKVTLPTQTHEGTDTVSIGWSNKLGLPYLLSTTAQVVAAALDGVRETTFPTVTASKTDLELNTLLLNSALNGKAVDIYLMV